MGRVEDPMIMGERELTQVLSDIGVEPPAKFFQNEVMPGVADGSLPVIDVPKVDISLLSSSCPATAKAETEKLRSALLSYGCCFALNHGMTSEFLDEVRQVADDFFKLPLEEKCKLSRPIGEWQGYGFDEVPDNYESHDWSDRLMIMISPDHLTNLRYWPLASLPNFRETMKELSKNIDTVLVKLLKGMARSLGLDESSLVDEMGEEPRTVMRLNLYPKCSVPDRVLGLNSHTDGSAITFLLQDKEVEGFQLLLKDGQWARVPVTPTDALLIKIGDQGEIISNGEYKAPLHRGALNTKRARKSIAIFSLPGLDKAIGPAKGLEPARYKQITNYEVYHLKLPNHRALIDDLKIDPTN
ncbi:Protein SRG1 [Linum perenne]